MDHRMRSNLTSWFTEAGFLYLVVVVFVGLLFLLREGWGQFSCNPTVNKTTTIEGGPGYYGRNP